MAVTDAHLKKLVGAGADISCLYSPYKTRFLRAESRSESLDLARESHIVKDIEACDFVVINGEGSIHHKGGQDLLCIAELAIEMVKPVFLVNAVMQDVSGYDDVLKRLDDLTVREPRSADFLASRKIPCRIVADSILEAEFDNDADFDFSETVLCTDWQAQRDRDVGEAISAYMDEHQTAARYFPFIHWSYHEEGSWKKTVANFRTARIALTARHHAVYVAGMAGIPFVAMPSNTHKIEGLIEYSGIDLPLARRYDEIETSMTYALKNASIFKEFSDFLQHKSSESCMGGLLACLPEGRERTPTEVDTVLGPLYKELYKEARHLGFELSFRHDCQRVKSGFSVRKQRSVIQHQRQKLQNQKEVIDRLKMTVGNQKNKIVSIVEKNERLRFSSGIIGKEQEGVSALYKSLSEGLASGNYHETRSKIRKHLNHYPFDHMALYYLGLVNLYLGNVTEGMPLLRHRSLVAGYLPKAFFAEQATLWDGSSTDGKIVLWSTLGPGIGSEIFCLSFLTLFSEYSDSIAVVCDPRLIPVMQRSFSNMDFLSYDELHALDAKDVRYHCSLLSLFSLYGGKPLAERLPSSFPYLRIDDAVRQRFRDKYKSGSSRTLIGISWHTPNKLSGAERSVSGDEMLGLDTIKHKQLVSLQHGAKDLELYGNPAILFDESFDCTEDIDQLVHQVAAMDYVVTIDNSVAFIAGALNIPTILLLSEKGNWPWEIVRSSRYYFPSVKIIQRKAGENWSAAIKQAVRLIKRQKNPFFAFLPSGSSRS